MSYSGLLPRQLGLAAAGFLWGVSASGFVAVYCVKLPCRALLRFPPLLYLFILGIIISVIWQKVFNRLLSLAHYIISHFAFLLNVSLLFFNPQHCFPFSVHTGVHNTC